MHVIFAATSSASNQKCCRENVIIIKAFNHMPIAIRFQMHLLFRAICEHHGFNFYWWERSLMPTHGQRLELSAVRDGCSKHLSLLPEGFLTWPVGTRVSSHRCFQWTLLNYASSYWWMLAFKIDGCSKLQGSAIIFFISLSLSLASCMILFLVKCLSASTDGENL